MSKLEELIQQVRAELGADFISTDVVGMDGLSIAGGSIDPNFNATDASARFAMVMKLAERVSAKVGMGKVDDNLVSTDKAYIMTRFLGDSSYYWGLAVSRNATLGSVRLIMNEYAPQIWDAIPH
jgi:predicted regulator of Ras-like GTPase activity (Roadblock/LC7/MglB family)